MRSSYFWGLGGGRAGAAPGPALETLALEVAATGAELEDVGARAAAPSRATLDRDLGLIRGWRTRLETLVPRAARGRASTQAHDALFLRAQFVHMTRLIATYKAAVTARAMMRHALGALRTKRCCAMN